MTWVPMSYLTSKRVWINVWEQWFRWWQAGWALRCIGMWGVIKLYGSNGLDGLYHVSMYVVSQFCEKYNVVVRCNICINVWSMSPTFLPCHDSLVQLLRTRPDPVLVNELLWRISVRCIASPELEAWWAEEIVLQPKESKWFRSMRIGTRAEIKWKCWLSWMEQPRRMNHAILQEPYT